MLLIPALWLPGFLLFAALELAVPVWAERAALTTWHPHHIAERYGLLTLIVLGESILAATVAIQSALASGERLSALLPIIIGGLLIVYSLWWFYFDRPVHDLLTTFRRAFIWGYGHYVVFAAAAAVGAGLAAAVDAATHQAKIGAVGAGAAVAVHGTGGPRDRITPGHSGRRQADRPQAAELTTFWATDVEATPSLGSPILHVCACP